MTQQLGVFVLLLIILLENGTISAAKDDFSGLDDVFLEQIYRQYGRDDILSGDGFKQLLSDLNIGHSSSKLNKESVLRRISRDVSGIQGYNTTSGFQGNSTLQECYSQQELLDIFKIRFDNGLSREVFFKICPVLLVHVDSKICPSELAIEAATGNTGKAIVWGYGIGSVCAISVSGLIAVGFIPCLRRVFLNTLLQFLVALAIGALSGDALLHLLPHSLGAEVSPAVTVKLKHEEHQGVYKGLCGLAGIFLFYIFSRLQAIISKMKDDRMRKKEQKENGNNYRDYTLTISDEEETIIALNADVANQKDSQQSNHDDDDYHGHGHERDIPRTARALALRVIIGDGIHNFSDGLAIGVAFADSVIGGFSTSVAVFCHELPHEMGDFAVLLKKGMSVKQAVLYNCLSSLLSLIGMFIGLALGNIGDMSQWLFLGIAGMFLYISLVDLLPEMNMIETGTKEKHPLLNLLYQLTGIFLGVGVMLLIALYEEDLKNVFDN